MMQELCILVMVFALMEWHCKQLLAFVHDAWAVVEVVMMYGQLVWLMVFV